MSEDECREYLVIGGGAWHLLTSAHIRSPRSGPRQRHGRPRASMFRLPDHKTYAPRGRRRAARAWQAAASVPSPARQLLFLVPRSRDSRCVPVPQRLSLCRRPWATCPERSAPLRRACCDWRSAMRSGNSAATSSKLEVVRCRRSVYHRCCSAETKMNCMKLGSQKLMAQDFGCRTAELQVRIAILTRYTALGIHATQPAD